MVAAKKPEHQEAVDSRGVDHRVRDVEVFECVGRGCMHFALEHRWMTWDGFWGKRSSEVGYQGVSRPSESW